MRSPRLEIFPDRIRSNAASVIGECHKAGIRVACVTKVLLAHPEVAHALFSGGADMLADSRLENLERLRSHFPHCPLVLLRFPAPSEAREIVETVDISLNSSLATLHALDAASLSRGIRHQVIIMTDLGDLREGVWPERLRDLLIQARDLKGIEILGLGANLGCYGGVIPTVENMSRLVEIRNSARIETGLGLPLISGGNSSALPLLRAGTLPGEVNHLRIGETIILGRNPIDRAPWPGTRQDTVRLVAEIIEIERKPSVPIGPRMPNALGRSEGFPDRGIRLRALCNLGRQDTVIEGLVPVDPGIAVLGGSSDHLILDVEEAANDLEVGGEVHFQPDYGALLALSTSPFVEKTVIRGE